MDAWRTPWTRGRGLVRLCLAGSLVLLLALACNSAPPVTTPTATPGVTASPPPATPTAGSTIAPTLFDFGDAPDPSYPSLLASNGARTRVIDRFWLGNLRSPSVTNEADARVVNRDELDDGLEAYIPFGAEATLVFRAVKSGGAADGVVYFNLLIDFDGDGRWQGDDWVERNRGVDLAPGEEELIEVSTGFIQDTWIRATLTDGPVADSAADWDGTGEFAQGEVEDYFIPAPPSPPESPPPTPTYSPSPTPTPSPSPTPERTIVTPSHAPTPSPSPTFVYTGDFVVVCEPDPAAVIHGESVTMAVRIVSGEHTPPERFQARVGGGEEFGGGTAGADPAAGEDGWSEWGDGATVTYTSTHVDPPSRLERTVVVLTLQSLSTTRIAYCIVEVTHMGPSPTATTQVTEPTIRVEPEIVELQLVGQVSATLSGSGFTPEGQVNVRIKPPNHQAITASQRADAQGRFSIDLQFQSNMPKGTYEVSATDRTSGATAETTFEVR